MDFFSKSRMFVRARPLVAAVVAAIAVALVGVTAALSQMPGMAGRTLPPTVNTHDGHGNKYRYTFSRNGELMLVKRNGTAWLSVLHTDNGWVVIDPTVSQTHLFTLPLPSSAAPAGSTTRH